jgi:hypothetical protein
LFRRIILSGGHGRPASFADESIEAPVPSSPGHELALIWGADDPPTIGRTVEEAAGPVQDFFPEVGGSRFYLQTLPAGYGIDPGRGEDMDYDSVTTMVAETPSLSSTMFVSNGYHYTNTVDCGVIIAGSVWLIGPKGEERELVPGDSFVDVGAPHAWENRSSDPCTFALFIVGADRARNG